MSKSDNMERNTRSKSEQEFVKALIHSLSLQRLTDQQIVEYLHNEKQIEIARTTVNAIRNRLEKQAERWYIELRNSAYKYLAAYKQRIDSLLSYQKTLHEIISNTNRDEVKIRAIGELHSIEMDIFNLWKQLPVSNIVSTVDNSENERKSTWAVKIEERKIPKAILRIPLGDEKEEPEYWANNDRKESEAWTTDPVIPRSISEPTPETNVSTLITEIQETISIAIQEPDSEPTQSIVQEPEQEQEPEQKNDVVDIDVLGRFPKPFDVEPWVQCNFNNSNCNKWFKNKEIRNKHIAKYHT